jgi:hypothetical protein
VIPRSSKKPSVTPTRYSSTACSRWRLWSDELTCGDAPGDVLEQDPCLFERPHEANDVNVRRREQLAVVGLEEAETLQPGYIL